MIYDYYCIDCGEKFEGKDIRFDMAELLGLRQENSSEKAFESRATMVDLDRLNEFARYSGTKNGLRHGEECVITVTLREFLELMADNEENKEVFGKISESTYGDKKDILKRLYTGKSIGEEMDEDVGNFESAIQARFIYTGEEDSEQSEDERDLDDFEASFRVEPEFFENGRSDAVYTLKYNYDLNAVNLRKLGPLGEIRGYCPKCGKAVVAGAGKYRHTLVGLLGAQKAGKTSTIVAMLEELRINYRKLGIRYPGNPLWDSRSTDREINVKLYRNGWAMMKTAVDNNEGSFNATLLIEADDDNRTDEQKKQIFTFVDIAGEQCFDIETNTVNLEAFQVYPLINRCHIFLLCTGIAPEEEDKDKGQMVPPEAILEISRGIYDNLREPENIPPICIVATKADLAGDAEEREESDNPFRRVLTNPEYQFEDELQNLSMLYDAATDEDVRNALDICLSAYDELSRVTYVSAMSCWALGRKAEKLPKDMDIHNITPYRDLIDGKMHPFHRMRVGRLCRWIFQVTGVLAVDGYTFPYIPSFGEGYRVEGMETRGVRKKYSVEEACDRIEAVKKVFINCPDAEENLRMELRYYEENRNKWRWEKKRRKAIQELLGV